MLNKIFGSHSRVKILKIFLSKPNEKFFIRQLARDLKLQVNSVRRELENLEEFGLLSSEFDENAPEEPAPEREDFLVQSVKDIKIAKDKHKKNKEAVVQKTDKKYYRVNKDFVLFEEIKALIMKAQILYEKDFIKKLYNAGKPKVLILTGLFVNSPAPVDILIVGQFNKVRLLKVIKEMEADLCHEINYTVMNVAEYKYRRGITDVFLYDIFERKNIKVIDEIE